MRKNIRKNIRLLVVIFFILVSICIINNKVYGADVTITEDDRLNFYVEGTQRYDYAKQVVDLVNQERAKKGLNTLEYDEELTNAAMQRAAEISVNFDHGRPNGSQWYTVLSGKLNAENIAAGSNNAQDTMKQWMNSIGHRENILKSGYKTIGIGCMYIPGTNYGGWYWVQLFSYQNVGKSETRTNTQNVSAAIVDSAWTETKINIDNNSKSLEVGSSSTLHSFVCSYSAKREVKDEVSYSSSDNSVAIIQNGKVKGIKAGNVKITAKIKNQSATLNLKIYNKEPNVAYRTHVQDVGWQNYVKNGVMAGTSGRSLRLEGINIKLENQPYSGDIEYCTHVQDIGWQSYVKNNAMSGTSGRSLRLEAIKIRLTGEMSNNYDIYYRVHTQDIGWMNWAKNGESAGSAGYSYRLEGIEIVIVKKGNNPPTRSNTVFSKPFKCHKISYRTHVQDYGWQGFVYDGAMAGTSGQAKRLEGININLENKEYNGDIEYSTHVQNIGWQGFVKNGAMAGTSGRSLRLEAIKIRLTGEMANQYDVYYRVHCQDIGWMDWAKNGEEAGTAGYSYRLEGINIVLVEKGGQAPGSTANHFYQYVAPTQTTNNNYNTSSNKYIINTRTGKYHRPTCGTLKNANSGNLRTVYESSDSLKAQGYSACKDCKP